MHNTTNQLVNKGKNYAILQLITYSETPLGMWGKKSYNLQGIGCNQAWPIFWESKTGYATISTRLFLVFQNIIFNVVRNKWMTL